MIACAKGRGRTPYTNVIKIAGNACLNKVKSAISVYFINFSGEIKDHDFYDVTIYTVRANFNLHTNYKGNIDLQIRNLPAHLFVLLNDNGDSGYSWLGTDIWGNDITAPRGNQGTLVYSSQSGMAQFDLNISQYASKFDKDWLKVSIVQCGCSPYSWSNLYTYIKIGNLYYYKVKLIATNASNVSFTLVEEGKYYSGAIPNT